MPSWQNPSKHDRVIEHALSTEELRGAQLLQLPHPAEPQFQPNKIANKPHLSQHKRDFCEGSREASRRGP